MEQRNESFKSYLSKKICQKRVQLQLQLRSLMFNFNYSYNYNYIIWCPIYSYTTEFGVQLQLQFLLQVPECLQLQSLVYCTTTTTATTTTTEFCVQLQLHVQLRLQLQSLAYCILWEFEREK